MEAAGFSETWHPLHFVVTPKYEVTMVTVRACLRVKLLHGCGHTVHSFRVVTPTRGTAWYLHG
jgi:hypothetical protein